MRGRIGCHHFDCVSAIREQRRVERVELVSQVIFEQQPARLPVFAQIDFLPRAPVAVGIVDIPATREEFDVACAAKFSSPPAREDASIKNIAFVTSLCFWGSSQQKDLSQVTCGSIDSTIASI